MGLKNPNYKRRCEMARIFEFMVVAPTEPGAGLNGYEEKVTIIFHHAPEVRKMEQVDEIKEETETIREFVAELFDAKCITLAEYERDRINEAVGYGKDIERHVE